MRPETRRLLIAPALLLAAACGSDGGSQGGGGHGSATTGSQIGSGAGGAGHAGGAGAGGSQGQGGQGAQGGDGGGGPCVDECPAPSGGLTVGCEKRFAYGVNYAWKNFGGDFGGISPWGQTGVAENPDAYAADLQGMRDHGAGVIRWWVFPDFRGDGIVFDASGTPTGLGGTALEDLEKALELAEAADVYLVLTLFSFDDFRPDRDVSGIYVHGLRPIIEDPAKRTALLDQVVRPFVQAASASPHAKRLLGWDLINEPEWAITGPSLYGGDQAFDPNGELESVTHAEMEAFLSDVAGVVREESDGLITVGGAAAKWAHAWTGLGLDFYQLHWYAWVNDYWPYTNPPSTYGLDAPLVAGEFPLGDLDTGIPYEDVVESLWNTGFAGAWSWMYTQPQGGSPDLIDPFAAEHPCETHL